MANEKDQRSVIISAATKQFSRFGLEKTTMEDIAKSAAKAKSSLYYYFNSKEEIFTEVIQNEMASLKSTILEALEREEEPYEQFRALVKARLGYLNDKADDYTTIRDDYLSHHDFIEELRADYSIWEIEMIRSIVEKGRNKGLFLVTDSAGTSRAIFFALKGLEYPWAVDLNREETERSIDILVDILLKGISRG